PYNETFLDYLRAERARGRSIVLATAAPHEVADRIAAYLGLFDQVIASDGVTNLRGAIKAEALCRLFGESRFVYCGNSTIDHAIWQKAGGAVVVNPRQGVLRSANERYENVEVIGDKTKRFRAAIKASRPYQWVKNLLVFIPLLVSGSLTDTVGWVA